MRNRHWEQLSNSLGMQIRPKANLTFAKCLELGLQNHIEAITKVAEVAGKEFSIEQVMNKCMFHGQCHIGTFYKRHLTRWSLNGKM